MIVTESNGITVNESSRVRIAPVCCLQRWTLVLNVVEPDPQETSHPRPRVSTTTTITGTLVSRLCRSVVITTSTSTTVPPRRLKWPAVLYVHV